MSEEKEFWDSVYDELIEAQESLQEALTHLNYMQNALRIVNIKVFTKMNNETIFKNDTKE